MSTGSQPPLRCRGSRPAQAARLVLALLVLVLGAGLLLAPPAGAAAGTAGYADQGDAGPLRVELTGLSPGVVPRSGAVTLTGTVTNTEQAEWRDVNVHAWASQTPMTTSAQLAEASLTPYDAEVGQRLTAPRTFVSVGDLDPGQSASFTIRVPRSLLPIPDAAGVYWIGLHALGTSTDGRDSNADGRARTFIPVVAPSARKHPLTASFVLPLRQEVRRDAAGRLREPGDWATLLGSGRLARLLGLAESAGSVPLTVLLDPAVLDAAHLLGRGNVPTASDESGATGKASSDGAAQARSWLARVVRLTTTERTLGLGYADPDAASLAARDPALLAQARRLARSSLAARGVSGAVPAVAPTDGVLPASSLPALGQDSQVLVSAKAAARGTASLARTTSGQPLALVDTAATAAGPGPGATTDALTYRQRILAEAALKQSTGTSDPLVVAPPAAWDPGSAWQSSAFFAALDVPWLRWSALGEADRDSSAVVDSLSYSASDRRAQVGDRLVGATRAAARSGKTFAAALEQPGDSADAYSRLALQGTSYAARGDREGTYDDVRALDDSIRARLSKVRVNGSRFVTLSGGSGSFVVSMVNDLDRPVKVGLSATISNDDLTLQLPDSVVLPARQRTTVRIQADSKQTGVRAVRISPTTANGTRIGTPLVFNVRDSQVSSLIWAVLGGGLLLLVAMIVRRFRRRGLRRSEAW